MGIIKTSLICFVVCVASASAYGGSWGSRNFYRPQMLQVNASTIWINKPVNDTSPLTIAPVGSPNNGEGLTLNEFCKYVVENGTTPWLWPEQKENDFWSQAYIPSLENVKRSCSRLANDKYMLSVPFGRGQTHGGRLYKRNIVTEEKKPGL